METPTGAAVLSVGIALGGAIAFVAASTAYHAHNVVQVTAEAVQEVVPDVVTFLPPLPPCRQFVAEEVYHQRQHGLYDGTLLSGASQDSPQCLIPDWVLKILEEKWSPGS